MTKLFDDQEEYCICNSPLTECAVVGFEVGYASTIPNALVVWEAQYGDFANVGQPMFDNFISSGEVKWMRQCGLVMMLPHGMEGNRKSMFLNIMFHAPMGRFQLES